MALDISTVGEDVRLLSLSHPWAAALQANHFSHVDMSLRLSTPPSNHMVKDGGGYFPQEGVGALLEVHTVEVP